MNLPPLPLTNGVLFIDNSFLELLQTCPRSAQHSRLDARILAGEKSSLNFGTAIHKALEWRYKNCHSSAPSDADKSSMNDVLIKCFEGHQSSFDDHRTIDYAIELMARYNERYRMEPFNILVDKENKPMVELSFALPLYTHKEPGSYGSEQGSMVPSWWPGSETPIYYTGRIDFPVQWTDEIIITDHKTDSMLFGPSNFINEQKPSNQYRGYCWAFQELTGKEVSGFCVNGICTKKPPMSKPRTKTWEQWWDEMFVRDITYLSLSPTWAEDWKRETISMIENFFWLYSRGELPMWGKFTRACSKYGGCQYRDVCLAPTPEKGQEILQSLIFRPNEWSPLEKVKTKQ